MRFLFCSKPRVSLLAVDAEVVSLLGSEEEDEAGLWSFEPQDCQESLDKTSLTPSEATEDPGSPAHSTRPHSLSPGSRNCWGPVESKAKTEEDAAYLPSDRDGEQELLRMYCKLESRGGCCMCKQTDSVVFFFFCLTQQTAFS